MSRAIQRANPFLPLMLFLSSESREPRSADRYLDWSEFRPRTRRFRGFLHRGEKSLNRRSYRRAHRRTPRRRRYSVWRGFAAASRDKDPISTGRNRKRHARLSPVRLFLSTISNKRPREASSTRPQSDLRIRRKQDMHIYIYIYIYIKNETFYYLINYFYYSTISTHTNARAHTHACAHFVRHVFIFRAYPILVFMSLKIHHHLS